MSELLRTELDRLGLPDLHDVLSRNGIDEDTLRDLTESDLREMGLTLGQRKRFLRAMRGRPDGLPVAPVPAPIREPLPAAERRQLTTLFCDMVGSTRLATRLDPEDLRDVIDAYQEFCASVVRSHAGHVAFSQGDGIMAYFGFPFAREDDPERAVRAAFEICARLDELQPLAPVPLRTRIGIATGLVVVGDSRDPSVAGGNVVGETPNLAARLQEAAMPGEIVVSDSTRRLCGALFEYEPRGDLCLKGFPEPVAVHRVLGEGTARSRFEARASAGLYPIVGREAELERLRAVWRAALGGTGQVALLRGEAGIGKSRLARAFMEVIAPERPRVLQWFCATHLNNRPLHPVVREIESVDALGRTLPEGTRRAGLEALVAAMPRMQADDLPFLGDLLGIGGLPRPELDVQAQARRTVDALVRRVEGMAQDAPLLILMEDAHWADAATLEFLAVLIERIAPLPIMLLVTYRPEFSPPWSAPGRCTGLTLETLNALAGARLVDMVVRERTLPAHLVRTIIEKAGGVPLFVEELTKTVLDAVIDHSRLAESLATLTIPATLQDSLMARLDALGTAKELAQTGSVIGREFTPAMLRAIAPDHPDIEGDLRRLCASGLADENGEGPSRTVTFHHALVQDTAYESLLRRRRRDIHHAIAAAMLAQHPAFAGAEPEVVARHCTHGGLPEAAVAHWLLAGQQALGRAANLSALHLLRCALEQLELVPEGEGHRRTELGIRMALAPACMAIHGWGSPEVEAACRRARDLAEGLGDGESLFGATWGLWSNYFLRGEMEPALETARAVDAMAEAAGATLLRVAADHAVGFTLYFRGDLEGALARAEAGIARYEEETERQIARMFQFSSTTALFSFGAVSLWMMGREAEADAALGRALALPEELAHAPSLAFSLAFTQYTLLYRRDWRRVRETSQRLLALSEAEGFRLWIPQARTFLGLCEAAEGRLEEGLEAALASFEAYAATGTGLTLMQLLPHLGEFLIAAGRAGEAVQRLDAMIASAEGRREGAYLSELYRVRAVAQGALGRAEAALADIEAAQALARRQGAVTLRRRAEATRARLRPPGEAQAAGPVPATQSG
ncbi:adenylate/guanylate cyclase domain-containing protein [Roseicella aquatilis]|nr:adenylate/guanylate cyclase domain-containing protein [Roseicella aquatilis]